MHQRSWAVSTRRSNVMSSRRVDMQYLVGASSPLGHSIKSHSSGRLSASLSLLGAARTRTRAKREDRAFAPADLAPGAFRQAQREILDRDPLKLSITTGPLRRS